MRGPRTKYWSDEDAFDCAMNPLMLDPARLTALLSVELSAQVTLWDAKSPVYLYARPCDCRDCCPHGRASEWPVGSPMVTGIGHHVFGYIAHGAPSLS